MAKIAPQIPRPDAATPKEAKATPPRCMILNSADRARRELGLDALPQHVAQFGQFMLQQRQRDLTSRDVVKAYVLTRSSIQRSGLPPDSMRRTWPDHPFTGTVRPEDAMAYLLRTPDGKLYLDEAERGGLSKAGIDAAYRMAMKLGAFGGQNILYSDLTVRAPTLASKANDLAAVLRSGTKDEWFAWAEENIWGVGAAKSGFIASLLGRGDIPTADAREIAFWWKNRDRYTKSQRERLMRRFGSHLEARLAAMRVTVPPDLAPFYQHLVHHAIWDAVGGTQTTHADVASCMLLAGVRR